MLIPEHKIEEVLDRVDLVSLVSRHVELKKSGRSFKGRCPFHDEKTASFYVTPDLRLFKCFGCQAGGDAIAFVQRYQGKSFVDAVKELAREVGVDLEAAVDPSALERQKLREATDAAHEHFKSRLWDPNLGKKARAYLEERGVDEATAKAFGLGWAPLAWSELAERLKTLGLLEPGEKAGLIAPRKSGGYYDLFRGRLIIPIRSPEGRTIAFGGRLLEAPADAEPGPKYVNSRESKLYDKSSTLYGMDVARDAIRRSKKAVLVEGYFDCIGMHQAGVKTAVALCSTALTAGHLTLLSRSEAKELTLLLDGDEAGRKAVERLAGPLLAAGAVARVALLPNGEDPDTFARKSGPDGVTALLDGAKPLTEHLLATLLPQGRASSFEAKMAAVERLKPIAAQLPVGLMRSSFMSGMAAAFGVAAADLEASLGGGKRVPPKPVPKPGPSSAPASQAASAPAAVPREKPPDPLEAHFAACALHDRGLLARDAHRVADELAHPGIRSVVAAIAAGRSEGEVLEGASNLVRSAIQSAARHVPTGGASIEPTFAATCRKLKVRRIDEQLSHIARLTAALNQASDLDDETRRLLSERGELLALKRRVLEEGTVPKSA